MGKEFSVAVYTLGCKLNQAESEVLACGLANKGFRIVEGRSADCFVINTCSVTHIADRKSRHLVRMLRNANPGAVIAVTGCYAEQNVRELELCGADIALGNRQKPALVDLIMERLRCDCGTGSQASNLKPVQKVRSFIKVQDGCANFCTYCIVPYLRSQIASVAPANVVAEIRSRGEAGYQEAVLTGTEIGAYNAGIGGLAELVSLVLDGTNIPRLHLSSLQPRHISSALLQLWGNARMVRHFHLALQSGSDSVLKRMGRRYSTSEYREAVERIRAAVPGVAITTDIMVGFPGESDEEFIQSYDFCRGMGFAAMHVFAFSRRPGTAAAGMTGQVKASIKKERSNSMLNLAGECAARFAARFDGDIMDVLWENRARNESSIYTGLTGNYLRVYAASDMDVSGKITEAMLSVRPPDDIFWGGPGPGNGELWGKLLK
jgi:threonylcarbamoyladenosine tRNA methylthiotransferase MtaB